MFWNNLKIGLRNLLRHKGYSFINITGLAVGMTCTILIFLWVQDEVSYDRFHTRADDIYRVTSHGAYFNWMDGTPAPLGPVIAKEIPEIIHAVRFSELSRKLCRAGDNVFYEDGMILVDSSFFQVFSFPLSAGDPNTVFIDPMSIVLTESMAQKYFGDAEPMGKTLDIEGRLLTVSGVMQDIPHNSHLQFDFVASFELIDNIGTLSTHWGAFNFVTYLLVEPSADLDKIHNLMTDIGKRNGCPQVENGVEFYLKPLSVMHLNGRNYYRGYVDAGSLYAVYGFSAIAILVLIVACINFVNLSTARSVMRSKEVGMRKTVGASRSQLMSQFLGESVLIAGISMILALVLVELFLPFFNNLAGKQLAVDFSDYRIIIGFVSLVIITGLFAGSYPELYLTTLQPVKVFTGTALSGTGKSWLRKVRVVTQFTLSIALIAGTSIVYQQLHYINSKELGFNREHIIWIPAKGEIGSNYDMARTGLLQDPDITSVTAQDYLPVITMNRTTAYNWEGKDPDVSQDMLVSRVGYDYFETLKMEIVEGRSFSQEFSTDATQGYILNQEAIRQMGIENPVGKSFTYYDREGTIIGVVHDANLRSLHSKIEPHVFYVLNDLSTASSHGVVLIKINGDNAASAITSIKKVWSDVNPAVPIEYHFLDETYDRSYWRARQIGSILISFSCLAIFISCLGLLGLVSFMAERRTKEIGIRKVVGASVGNIVQLMIKEFVILVAIANIIACPIAYYIMNQILQKFAYRISIGPWVFVGSAVVVFAIALLTVSFQAVKTALSNPVKALRYE